MVAFCETLADRTRNPERVGITCIVDVGGNAVERYMYDPYGNVTILDGTTGGQTDWADDANQLSDVDNEILYCGYRHDPETGLYHIPLGKQAANR